MNVKPPLKTRLRNLVVGQARSLSDSQLFHQVSLVAVMAWVGLGADGLSSSCYGPEETFRALGTHPHLALIVMLMCVGTILVICASYAQIIELFPSGGGGYLVATKLLSPAAGVVSGSALLIDYVLTISISIASGADAVFSFLPVEWQPLKLTFGLASLVVLTILNLRGVRESVLVFVPIFFLFLATHAVMVLVAIGQHAGELPQMAVATAGDFRASQAQLGWLGLAALLLRAFSMGAGTFTGIEAVSNGLPILREPRVQTGKRTMVYMGASLAFMVAGLLLAYLLHDVKPVEGKTLNAVLFASITAGWGLAGKIFSVTSLVAAAALLIIAAQAGFLDGPRVLANMALDRWFPARFTSLSDRFVSMNGILIMGSTAALVLLATRGAVDLLVVLYSINVFITFSLSQLGMVTHWWRNRAVEPNWKRKLAINGVGLVVTTFILVTLTVIKFHEGGWVTLLVTGAVVTLAFGIKRHYDDARAGLARLDPIVETAEYSLKHADSPMRPVKPGGKTAVILVNGFNGLGLHTLLHAMRLFGDSFRRYVFVQVGVVDAGNFKGAAEVERLGEHIAAESARYVRWMNHQGYEAEAVTALGTDVVGEVSRLATEIQARHGEAVFFGGQLVFEHETWMTRLLHNYTVFSLQRRLYRLGVPFLVLPVTVDAPPASR
jgi:amino acid transporter